MVEHLNAVARLWWGWSAAMFWQVGLLILVIATIDRLIRRWAWPQLRYALWSLILVKLLLPPSLSLPSGIVPGLTPAVKQALVRLEPEKPVAAEGRVLFSLNEDMLRVPALAPDGIGQSARSVPVRAYPETPYGVATNGFFRSTTEAPSSVPIAWQVYAMMASLAGTLILGIWLFVRLHSFVGRNAQAAAAASLPQSFYNQLAGCARRLELRCIPRVVVTKRLATPAVFGMFRPVLLMPRGYLSKLSRRDTEHMLLHELAHIKRGDLVAHGLYMLLQIVYWYNPLLWLVRRQMHHLRELSCDATVAALLRERTPAYRQTLLETARRLLTSSVEPGLGLLGLFEDSNRLLVRLDWLTKPTWRYRTMKRVTVATVAVLMLACVLPMARAQEAVSPESSPAVVQHDDQSAQEIAALQARLEELMAQQQDLRKQLDTLRQRQQQAGPSNIQSRREVTQRHGPEPFNMHVVQNGDTLASIAKKFYGPELGSRPENINRIAQANHLDDSGLLHTGQSLRIPIGWMLTEDETAHPTHEQGDVTVVPWQGQESTEQQQRAMSDFEAQRVKAEQRMARAKAEARMAQAQAEAGRVQAKTEAGRVQAEAQRAVVAGGKAKEEAKRQQEWAKQYDKWAEQMQQWQADVKKWQNSEEMKRWQQEMEQWGRETGRRYEQNADANAEANAPGPMSPMPPMPAMPPMPGMPANVHVPAVTPHVRATPHPAPSQSAPPQPVPHVNVTVPHIGNVPVPPVAPPTPHEPEQVVPCGDFVVKSLAADATLQVENNVGSIAVEGTEDRDCTVTATARIRGVDQEEAERIAGKIVVQVTPADGQVRVRTQLPEDLSKEQRNRIAIDLRIAVPGAVQVQATQKVGNIRLSSLRGDVKAAVETGSVKTSNLQGNVAIRINVGNIEFATSTDLSAKVSAQTRIGSISSNLPLEITGASAVHSGNAQMALGSHAAGTLGDGQHKIDLTTNVGSIQIQQKSATPEHEGF